MVNLNAGQFGLDRAGGHAVRYISFQIHPRRIRVIGHGIRCAGNDDRGAGHIDINRQVAGRRCGVSLGGWNDQFDGKAVRQCHGDGAIAVVGEGDRFKRDGTARAIA